MRINSTIVKTSVLASLSVLSSLGIKIHIDDISNAEKIKEELRNHEYKKVNKYVPVIAVNESEINEPFLNKTAYWEVEAEKIRKTLDKKQRLYNSQKQHRRIANSIYEIYVLEFAESDTLKLFLKKQAADKKKTLKKNPGLKEVYSKIYKLDGSFPSINIADLSTAVKNDTDWIPNKFEGYNITKEKVKVKKGKKYYWELKIKKEPIYTRVYKNPIPFFEESIKEDENGKYLVCKYYATEDI